MAVIPQKPPPSVRPGASYIFCRDVYCKAQHAGRCRVFSATRIFERAVVRLLVNYRTGKPFLHHVRKTLCPGEGHLLPWGGLGWSEAAGGGM